MKYSILILMVLFLNSTIYADIDWESFGIDQPCTPVGSQPYPSDWGEPKEFTICVSDHPQLGCDPNCCFTIVYYEGVAANYQISIGGVFHENGVNCQDCNILEIINVFLQERIEVMENEQDLLNEIIGTADYWSGEISLYKMGFCTDIVTGDKCSENKICCLTLYDNFILERDTAIYQQIHIVSYPDYTPYHIVSHDICDEGCEVNCSGSDGGIMFEEMPFSQFCDIECNTGEWVDESSGFIPVDGCPECLISIDFQKRVTEHCNGIEGTFEDYLITGIEVLYTSTCEACQLDISTLHSYASYWIANNAFSTPDPGECKNYYRIITSTCWDPFVDQNNTYNPCNDFEDGCCWKQFEVCNIGGVKTISLINFSTPQIINCGYHTYPCEFICTHTFPKLNQRESDMPDNEFNANFNSLTNELEIFVNNQKYGNFDLIIFDMLGKIVYSNKLIKSNNELRRNIPIDLEKGFYMIDFKYDNQIRETVKLIVE